MDGGKKARRPENESPVSDNSRKGLSGLGDTEQEKWRTDPCIYELRQLSDNFTIKTGRLSTKVISFAAKTFVWAS